MKTDGPTNFTLTRLRQTPGSTFVLDLKMAAAVGDDHPSGSAINGDTEPFNHFISNLVDDLDQLLQGWMDEETKAEFESSLEADASMPLDLTDRAVAAVAATSTANVQGSSGASPATHRRTPSASLHAMLDFQQDMLMSQGLTAAGLTPEDEDEDAIQEEYLEVEPGNSIEDDGVRVTDEDLYAASIPVKTEAPGLGSVFTIHDHPTSFAAQYDVLERMGKWYRPDCKRWDVQTILSDSVDGSFIVRPSGSYDGNLVLCVRFQGIVLHFLLDRCELTLATSDRAAQVFTLGQVRRWVSTRQ